jgi:hypothetical protein
VHRAHLLESCHVRRELYRFGLGLPIDEFWLDLPKPAPPTVLDPWESQDTSVQKRRRESLQRAGLSRGAVKCIGWTMILVRGS